MKPALLVALMLGGMIVLAVSRHLETGRYAQRVFAHPHGQSFQICVTKHGSPTSMSESAFMAALTSGRLVVVQPEQRQDVTHETRIMPGKSIVPIVITDQETYLLVKIPDGSYAHE
jgi:hypothetical protein